MFHLARFVESLYVVRFGRLSSLERCFATWPMHTHAHTCTHMHTHAHTCTHMHHASTLPIFKTCAPRLATSDEDAAVGSSDATELGPYAGMEPHDDYSKTARTRAAESQTKVGHATATRTHTHTLTH